MKTENTSVMLAIETIQDTAELSNEIQGDT